MYKKYINWSKDNERIMWKRNMNFHYLELTKLDVDAKESNANPVTKLLFPGVHNAQDNSME